MEEEQPEVPPRQDLGEDREQAGAQPFPGIPAPLAWPLNHMRMPPMYKAGHHLDLYLRRFQGYADAMNIPEQERTNILQYLLDDTTLSAIERRLAPRIQYAELVQILREELGIDTPNREAFVFKLRNRRRGKHEGVREFYQELFQLSKKAYPQDENIANNALRESFIHNLNDTHISARLKEHPEYNNERMLQFATTLEACKTPPAGKGVTFEVNETTETTDSELDGGAKGKRKSNPINDMKTMVGMLTKEIQNLSTQNPKPGNGINEDKASYSYNGPKVTPGLGSSSGWQNPFQPSQFYENTAWQAQSRQNPNQGFSNNGYNYGPRNQQNGGRYYNSNNRFNQRGDTRYQGSAPQRYHNEHEQRNPNNWGRNYRPNSNYSTDFNQGYYPSTRNNDYYPKKYNSYNNNYSTDFNRGYQGATRNNDYYPKKNNTQNSSNYNQGYQPETRNNDPRQSGNGIYTDNQKLCFLFPEDSTLPITRVFTRGSGNSTY